MLCCFGALSAFAFIVPPNDDRANATMLPTNGTEVSVSTEGATFSQEDTTLLDPDVVTCISIDAVNLGCLWGDVNNPHNGVDNSLWFYFMAPPSGAVEISACNSTYDSQLALFKEVTPGGAIEYVYSNEDGDGCENYAAKMRIIECLTPGAKYFVLADGFWDGNSAYPSGGYLSISVTAKTAANATPTGAITTLPPTCVGDTDGYVDIRMSAGIPPFKYVWSTGSTDVYIDGLGTGTYSVTVTDFCGKVATFSALLPDGSNSGTITLSSYEEFAPACHGEGTGAAGVKVATGTPPFTYTWSDGLTSRIAAYRSSLAPGSYTVTVTEKCGNTMQQVLNVAAGPSIMPADVMITPTANCTTDGYDAAVSVKTTGFNGKKLSYTTDPAIDGMVACQNQDSNDNPIGTSQNSYWTRFMSSDFGLTGQEYKVKGINHSIFVARPNFDENPDSTLFSYHVFYYTIPSGASDLGGLTAFSPKLASKIFRLPVMDSARVFFPLEATIPAGQDLVVSVGTVLDADFTNQLYFLFTGGNGAVSPGHATYLTSSSCGLNVPSLISELGTGFSDFNLLVDVILEPTVSWSPMAGVEFPASANTQVQAGTYTVSITDECGTTGTATVEVTNDICSGIVSVADHKFEIKPNPSNGLFNLTNGGANNEFVVEVFSIQGQLVNNSKMFIGNGTTKTLDLTTLSQGMYMLKLTSEGKSEIHRLVIQ